MIRSCWYSLNSSPWELLDEYVTGFLVMFKFFASFFIGQISSIRVNTVSPNGRANLKIIPYIKPCYCWQSVIIMQKIWVNRNSMTAARKICLTREYYWHRAMPNHWLGVVSRSAALGTLSGYSLVNWCVNPLITRRSSGYLILFAVILELRIISRNIWRMVVDMFLLTLLLQRFSQLCITLEDFTNISWRLLADASINGLK